ncbi:hypothetical protein SAMN05428988_1541 [Chitinophaga sp. YR573]|uniref:hypothetical protein n=1 Tax=Chitinophaga sp. YR573 TaxID=1881040 RepID=UPI0008BB94A9|nr:hypothetical protein [Chitinophaga sp. YR573]SEW04538.1 hypothetical protein SAMN05428988_1541 [Chitinophaga sp. YR573]
MKNGLVILPGCFYPYAKKLNIGLTRMGCSRPGNPAGLLLSLYKEFCVDSFHSYVNGPVILSGCFYPYT